jgi:riboflavin kinase/FMN adenylyltransferase
MKLLSPKDRMPLITLYEQKCELISRTGIDILIGVPFTEAFSELSAREFVNDLLIRRIGMQSMVVGRDYAFGRNREGNIDLLKSWSRELGFEVFTVDWIQSAGFPERISSTRIRELVMNGQMEAARKLLGRYYQIRGTVAIGRRRGASLLGFPTANIQLHDELCPQQGIYAVTVQVQGRTHQGVANIGYSPTFDDHVFTIEVHLLDFDKNIYGEPIRVNFIRRLRAEVKFNSPDALSAQIEKDIAQARDILLRLF